LISFAFSKAETWTKIHAAAKDGVGISVPSGRYGFTFALTQEREPKEMFFHGGDDGGNLLHAKSYVHNLLGDMWILSLESKKWRSLRPTDDRYLRVTQHCSLQHQGSVYLFGGLLALRRDVASSQGGRVDSLKEEEALFESPFAQDPHGETSVRDSNQLWRFSLVERKWTLIPTSGQLPAPRFGAASARLQHSQGSSLCIFGGYLRGSPNYNDLFCLSLPSKSGLEAKEAGAFVWTLVHPGGPRLEQGFSYPSPRGYSGLEALSSTLFMLAGARCDPGCSCSDEVWAFDTLGGKWQVLRQAKPAKTVHLAQRDAPVHRYKHTVVLSQNALLGSVQLGEPGTKNEEELAVVKASMYLFGGESFRPTSYWNDVFRFDVATPNVPTALIPAPLPYTNRSSPFALKQIRAAAEEARSEQSKLLAASVGRFWDANELQPQWTGAITFDEEPALDMTFGLIAFVVFVGLFVFFGLRLLARLLIKFTLGRRRPRVTTRSRSMFGYRPNV